MSYEIKRADSECNLYFKRKILQLISKKIAECEAKTRKIHGELTVDRIDVVALKELGQAIEKLEFKEYECGK